MCLNCGRQFPLDALALDRAEQSGQAAFRYAVFPGNGGDPACLCQSEAQAKHIARFWGRYGYYKAL